METPDRESRRFVRFVSARAATLPASLRLPWLPAHSRWLIIKDRSYFDLGELVMTPLFWYFPLIIFFGLCGVIISAREEQIVKRVPQAAYGKPEFSSREKLPN
jgi:hypothetical protein